MFKKSKKEATDNVENAQEAQSVANEIGRPDAEFEQDMQEADPFENIPTFTPGKPGFETGNAFAGIYVLTKRVYSNKFLAGKKDEAGKKYRDLHVLEDRKGQRFGIWSVAQLEYFFKKTQPGVYVKVQYDGKAEAALREGESPSHEFNFWTKDTHKTASDMQEGQ